MTKSGDMGNFLENIVSYNDFISKITLLICQL